MTDKERTQKVLEVIGQGALLKDWDRWNEEEKKTFCLQVENLDIESIKAARKLIQAPQEPSPEPITPFTDYVLPGEYERGRGLVKAGKVACLIVAGGQGTRLNFDGPKGAYPVTLVKNKSLFQLFAEKTLAAGDRLPIAIMTSPENHDETVNFFQEHHLFGLESGQLDFFVQGQLPFLDEQGNLFLSAPGHIAEGPDGNGEALFHLTRSGIWDKWKKGGVSYVVFMQVDNALADPFDATLVGTHVLQGNQVTVKCIQREDPDEPVGILAKRGARTVVVEYTEISEDERLARDKTGALLHRLANLSIFCFDGIFISDMAKERRLPLHLAYKKESILEGSKRVYKIEKFIFDVLPQASKVGAIVEERRRCFAPLKRASGAGSAGEVRQALRNFDALVFQEFTGHRPKDGSMELDPAFYYPSEALRVRWKNRPWPRDVKYLTP